MRLMMFLKLMIISLCASLLAFALLPETTLMGALKIFAFGTVISIAATSFYPDFRGVKAGDQVSVVNDSAIPALIGRGGVAAGPAKKNERVKITLNNGTEAFGVVESYIGLISPAKIRLIYEERLVE